MCIVCTNCLNKEIDMWRCGHLDVFTFGYTGVCWVPPRFFYSATPIKGNVQSNELQFCSLNIAL